MCLVNAIPCCTVQANCCDQYHLDKVDQLDYKKITVLLHSKKVQVVDQSAACIGKFWKHVIDRSELDSILQNHLPLLATRPVCKESSVQ